MTNHIDVKKYFETTGYDISFQSDYEPSYFEFYSYMKDIVINKNQVNTLDDLMNISDIVAIVTMENYAFSGNGILATCEVDRILKGSDYKDNKIKIYDHIVDLAGFYFNRDYQDNVLTYFEGNVPLKIGDKYLIFVKKAPNAVEKNTYMYSCLQYGAFRITSYPRILYSYEPNTKTLNEIMEYDIVYEIGQKHDVNVLNLYRDIPDFVNK